MKKTFGRRNDEVRKKTWNLWNYPDKDKKQSGVIDALVKSLNQSFNKLKK